MPKPDERFPARDRKVLRRLDESAMRQVALGILAMLFSFVAVVWIGRLWLDWPKMTVVFGSSLLLAAVLQGVLILGFDSLYPRGPSRWRRQFAATLLLRACIWSAFVVALIKAEGGGHLFFLAMFLPLTLGAALAATWLADIWTVRLYLAISLLPPMIGLLLEATPETFLQTIFLGIFLYALIRVADDHFRLFWRALGRGDAILAPAPLNLAVHARLLARVAEEFRRPVATVSDAMALNQSGSQNTLLSGAARRAAQQLVDRLEVLEDSARLLRGERVAEVVAGSLRRRCEEAVDDIGIVAAEAGVLCSTIYAADIPERLRTDYGLLFRGLRALAVWTLEQMPPGGELVLRFQVVPGQREDYLRCAVEVQTLYLPESLRNGLARTTQGSVITDPEVPLPLAAAAEIARLLGGRLTLVDQLRVGEPQATVPATLLALDVALDVVDPAADDRELRASLRGKSLLLVDAAVALAESIETETRALDMHLLCCTSGELLSAVRAREPMAILINAQDPAAAAHVLRILREGWPEVRTLSRNRGVVLLAAGAEAPLLPDDPKLATHWLRLPLGRRRLRQFLADVAGVGQDVGTMPPTVSRPLRVLVVEDNRVNQIVARGMLEKLGCELEIIDNGADAVERVAGGGLDLVLMDCEMPGMDGAEATRRIRRHEAEHNLPRLPIVAMTAHSSVGEIAGFLASGMDDCIVKPVSLASLATRIDRFRQRR